MTDTALLTMTLQLLIKLVPQIIISLKKGDEEWRNTKLGDLLIDKDYEATKARIKAGMENRGD